MNKQDLQTRIDALEKALGLLRAEQTILVDVKAKLDAKGLSECNGIHLAVQSLAGAIVSVINTIYKLKDLRDAIQSDALIQFNKDFAASEYMIVDTLFYMGTPSNYLTGTGLRFSVYRGQGVDSYYVDCTAKEVQDVTYSKANNLYHIGDTVISFVTITDFKA